MHPERVGVDLDVQGHAGAVGTALDEALGGPDDPPEIVTKQGTYYPQKIEVLKHNVWYSASKEGMVNPVVLSVEQIKQLSNLNKAGKMPSIKQEDTEDPTKKEFQVGSSEHPLYQPEKKSQKTNRKQRQEKNTYSK